MIVVMVLWLLLLLLMVMVVVVTVVMIVVMGQLVILMHTVRVGIHPAIQLRFARRFGYESLIDGHAAVFWRFGRNALRGKFGTKDGD